jgi:hypothetical protein
MIATQKVGLFGCLHCEPNGRYPDLLAFAAMPTLSLSLVFLRRDFAMASGELELHLPRFPIRDLLTREPTNGRRMREPNS